MSERSSEISGFYRRSIAERREAIREWGGLSDAEMAAYEFPPGIDPATIDRMIENVIGVFPLPLGVATHFRVNGVDRLVPMALEEPSVVAAASNSAKVARSAGGFFTSSSPPVMIGQVQLLEVPDPAAARHRILAERERLLDAANALDPVLVKFGGGAKDLEVRLLESPRGPMVVVHLLVDARDAGGMNAVNTMSEALGPELARIAGGRFRLRIISNLAIHRVVRARATFPAAALATENATGPQVVDAILEAYAFAVADPFRCATHNKGIMNGVDAVVLATGNDWRAVEAGAQLRRVDRGSRACDPSADRLRKGRERRPRGIDRGTDAGRARGRGYGGPSDREGEREAARGEVGSGAGRDHRLGRTGPELRRSARPRYRRNPARSHGVARAQSRGECRRPAR